MLGRCSQRFLKCLMKISRVRIWMAIDTILKKNSAICRKFSKSFRNFVTFPITIVSHKTPFSKTCQWKYDIVQIECKLSKKAFSVQSILVFHWLNLENDEIETCTRFLVMTTETSNTIAKTLISPVLMKRNVCSSPQKNKTQNFFSWS